MFTILKNKFLLLFFCVIFLGCANKNTPEYIAKQYLLALKDQDWDRAKNYADQNLDMILDMHKQLNTDFGFTEIKNIKCELDNDFAKCTYCCSSDSFLETRLKMKKIEGQWLVIAEHFEDDPLETTDTTADDN